MITVFGVGYVGLVQAAVLAHFGNDVTCIDVSSERIAMLNNGELPIFEPGLDKMVHDNHDAGRLIFTLDGVDAIKASKIIFIAVGTPQSEDGSANLSFVHTVARTIGETIEHDTIVVNKSTVPVGTADETARIINEQLAKRGVELQVDVVSNPEFLREGSALSDCLEPDRIIIGSEAPHAVQALSDLYAPLSDKGERILVMDPRSAELSKYAANCMLATRISFMNEMAVLADKLGANVENVRRGIGSDARIGPAFLNAGIGFGGSCFPKDLHALIHMAEKNGMNPLVLNAANERNKRQKNYLPKIISSHFNDDISGKTFALWGVAFKPNTDDMREASSIPLIEYLMSNGARVKAYDPEAMEECKHIMGDCEGLEYCGSQNDAVEGADALILATEWNVFLNPDFSVLAETLRDKVVFDGRNAYTPETVRNHGLTYYSIGRS